MSSSTSSPAGPRPTPTTASPLGFPAEWPLVWLRGRSKAAVGRGTFTAVKSHGLAKRYLERGANLGLLTGSRSGIAVLDSDRPDLFAEMEATLGPLTRFTYSGRGGGRGHYYVQWYPGLPSVITWKGETVGEILRDKQYVVIPPSIHPDTGQRYTWATDPLLTPIPPLRSAWQDYFATQPQADPTAQQPPEVRPLPPDEYARRKALALRQDGASERQTNGRIKFQCPVCATDDRHLDNAVLFTNGFVGCSRDDAASTHKAALRALFGITVGPRPDADVWTQEQIVAFLDDLIRPSFTATLSLSAITVLRAHATIVYSLGSWEYGASERQIAEHAGLQRSTVQLVNRQLRQTGWLVLTAKGTRAGKPGQWRLVPRRYRLQGTGQATDKVSFSVQSHPSKGIKEPLEKTGPSQTPFGPVAIREILAHDCFRNKVGLGKGCGQVYVQLLLAGPAGITIGIFGAAKKKTVSRQLDRLRAFALARYDRRTHRWTVGAASLDRVVKRLAANGRLAKQQRQHALDRDAWFPAADGTVVRFPTPTGPKTPRHRRPTPPLAPELQTVLDHLRARSRVDPNMRHFTRRMS